MAPEDRRPVEAVAAWALVALVIAGAAGSIVGGDPVWAGFALTVAGVAVVPALLLRDASGVAPPELLAIPTLPVLARTVGVHVSAPSGLSRWTAYAGVAALGLVIVAQAEEFGAVEMTRRFAVAFVAMTTVAVAALWTIARYAAGIALRGATLPSNDAVMADLVAAVGVGVLAGVVLDGYVQWRRPASRIGHGDGLADGSEDVDIAEPEAEPETDRDGVVPGVGILATAARALLAAVTGYALVTVDIKLLFNAGIPLAATWLPAAMQHRYGYEGGDRLGAWVAVAATLHVVGTLGLYRNTAWFDQLAHAFSAALVAGIGYALADTVDGATDAIELPREFRVLFILVFVLAAGVLWEVLEFGVGKVPTLIGGEPLLIQYGVADTVLDLSFDALGGVAVALWGGGHVSAATATLRAVLAQRW